MSSYSPNKARLISLKRELHFALDSLMRAEYHHRLSNNSLKTAQDEVRRIEDRIFLERDSTPIRPTDKDQWDDL